MPTIPDKISWLQKLNWTKLRLISDHHKKKSTLQGINISHLGKRKIIFKMPFLGNMLVPWRVLYNHMLIAFWRCEFVEFYRTGFKQNFAYRTRWWLVRNHGLHSPVEVGTVVYLPLFAKVLYTILPNGGWPWDIWAINRSIAPSGKPGNLLRLTIVTYESYPNDEVTMKELQKAACELKMIIIEQSLGLERWVFFRGWVKRVEFFVDEPTGGFLMFFVAKQSRKTKQVEVTLIVFDPESW